MAIPPAPSLTKERTTKSPVAVFTWAAMAILLPSPLTGTKNQVSFQPGRKVTDLSVNVENVKKKTIPLKYEPGTRPNSELILIVIYCKNSLVNVHYVDWRNKYWNWNWAQEVQVLTLFYWFISSCKNDMGELRWYKVFVQVCITFSNSNCQTLFWL